VIELAGVDDLQSRVHDGPASLPPLVYLPGLHGDWTLIGGFRRYLANRLKFVEITYPRTVDWSLNDYAAGIEAELMKREVKEGWVLAESFGSQVLWEMVARGKFAVRGVILAGGFVRHPARWAARMAERFCAGVPLGLLSSILFGYAKISRWRFRHSPNAKMEIEEFIARRNEKDRQAAKHRLRLVAASDACETARNAKMPVFALTGLIDVVVPWLFVRRWLKRNCVALREYKVVKGADHNVLGTAPEISADQVVQWIRETEGERVRAG
jgi:pimeloyl-ACP methyl ester carboxylesterase